MKTITLKCHYCKVNFKRLSAKHNYNITIQSDKYKHTFCSRECCDQFKSEINTVVTDCGFCGQKITRQKSQAQRSKTGKIFCNQSCAASYNNKLKRKSRRSKIEAKFYDLVVKEFPNLDILSNDKTMLDGYEVDVAIPELQLAIEWNGIVHFKPIYGQTKLDNIQTRDADKLKIASNKDINLIVIPDLVSNDKILKQAFNDVKIIIKSLIPLPGLEPGPKA